MNRARHIGVSLFLIWICLFCLATTSSAESSVKLQSFTAEYQLKRGHMIIGKVTTSLKLETDGRYTYTSITKPVGIVAAFSKDVITETSQGKIAGKQVIPSSYYFNHKRKKRPRLRKLQFDWSTNRVSSLTSSPKWSIQIPKGTQDKASQLLNIMLAINPIIRKIQINIVDKQQLKNYQITAVSNEQVQAGGTDYKTIKTQESKTGQPPKTTFWLAPKLNNLPVKIEKKEKKKTFTMTLAKYTQGGVGSN